MSDETIYMAWNTKGDCAVGKWDIIENVMKKWKLLGRQAFYVEMHENVIVREYTRG